jgi:hypothetical protein
MNKTITLTRVQREAFSTDDKTYYFLFSIVDSSLVGHPRQKSATSHHVVKVTIVWEVLVNWGLGAFGSMRDDDPDLVKLLFWYAKERIEEKVNSGDPPENDELTLTTQTAEAKCPFDMSLIPDPIGYVFDVNVAADAAHSPNEIFIEDIESFARACDVHPQDIKPLLPLNLSEDQIQTFFEEIMGENFHQADWGGEMNDLVTSHLRIGGRRLRAAFLLKGNGTKGILTIAKCGRNGDQIVRLTEAPVDLYVIQHVDKIDQRVIYDLASKVALKVDRGTHCKMCIIDGTDTARILRAYRRI